MPSPLARAGCRPRRSRGRALGPTRAQATPTDAALALRHGTCDGLYSASSGHPNIPTWVGGLAWGWLFTAAGKNDRIARQVRRSAGIAVFVGCCCERFARQASALGLAGQRPDPVVRFGRGPALPRSLRRPVDAVMV